MIAVAARRYDATEFDRVVHNAQMSASNARPATSSADEPFHEDILSLWKSEFDRWKGRFES